MFDEPAGDRCLWTWGCGSEMQLGLDSKTSFATPQLVNLESGVTPLQGMAILCCSICFFMFLQCTVARTGPYSRRRVVDCTHVATTTTTSWDSMPKHSFQLNASHKGWCFLFKPSMRLYAVLLPSQPSLCLTTAAWWSGVDCLYQSSHCRKETLCKCR